jgi:hypothetical protein
MPNLDDFSVENTNKNNTPTERPNDHNIPLPISPLPIALSFFLISLGIYLIVHSLINRITP